jgi:hypothetical protein
MERMTMHEPPEQPRDDEDKEGQKPVKEPDTLLSKMRKMRNAGLAAAVMGLAHEGTARADTAPQKDVPAHAEKSEDVRERDSKDLMKEMHSLWSEYGNAGQRSMQQETAVREKAASGETARLAADVIANLTDEKSAAKEVSALISILSTVNAQGVVYREYHKRFGHLPEAKSSPYYEAHLRDFAPSVADVKGEDVDPRLGLVARGSDSYSQAGMRSLLDNSGWATTERIASFKRLVGDQEIRAQAISADLTVAEYFSLIKASVKEVDELKTPEGKAVVASDPAFKTVLETATLDLPPERTAELVAKVLLEKRQQFSRAEVLGPSTETLIIMTGRDRRSDGANGGKSNVIDARVWNDIAKAAHVPDKAVHSLDASVQDPKVVAMGLIDAIKDSKGETVVALDTHGSPESIAVSVEAGAEMSLKSAALAHALTERLLKSGDKESLSHVTIVLDSCSSYDFAKSLSKEIRSQWADDGSGEGWAAKMKPGDIAMPRIITMAQEGSVGFFGATVGETLRNGQLKGIEKDGAVTGKRLLQNVQAPAYRYNDMTFFLPEHGGLLEIGANEQQKDDRAV